MSEWARLLDVKDSLIEEAQAAEDGPMMAGLVRTALGERDALLVFDDVWLVEDALLFKSIGGANCGRMLTTRIQDVADRFGGVHRIPELDAASSRDLIERHCPAATERFGLAIDRVLEMCGGLPLTLVLVAMRLHSEAEALGDEAGNAFLQEVLAAHDPGAEYSLEGYLMPTEGTYMAGTRTLNAVIDLTARNLTVAERNALRALTAFPPKANTFSAGAAAQVGGGRDHLRSLRNCGLVELVDRVHARLAMHQAIADYARRGGTGDDDAFRRMAEYFLDFLRPLDGDQPDHRADDLVPELENVRAVLEWTIRAREVSLGMRLMSALWPFWYSRNQFSRGRSFAERILAIAQPAEESESDRLLPRRC